MCIRDRAKGVLAFTGYNGILGYRTAASYSESPTYESDREMAAAVAQCLRDDGWELASHSWGHRNMGQISMENFITDTTKWENEVETVSYTHLPFSLGHRRRRDIPVS